MIKAATKTMTMRIITTRIIVIMSLPIPTLDMSPIASPIAKASPKLSVFANLHLAMKFAKANTMNKIIPIIVINQLLRKMLKTKRIIIGTMQYTKPTISNLIAFAICLTRSIPEPSFLLSIPYFIISKPYPSIKNNTRTKIIIPTIPNPAKATPPKPLVDKATAKSTVIEGRSIAEAARIIGKSYQTVHIWAKICESEGLEGLKPSFGGGIPSRLTYDQLIELDKIIEETPNMSMKDVHLIVNKKFDVDYSLKQIGKIVKKLGYNYSKVYPKFSKSPEDAEEQ